MPTTLERSVRPQRRFCADTGVVTDAGDEEQYTTATVLRLALLVAAAMTVLAAGFALARGAGGVPWTLHVAAIGGAAASAALAARAQQDLARLPTIELVLFAGVACYLVLAHVALLRALGGADARAAWTTCVLHASVLVGAYGVLVPNSRRRAALMIAALASLPLLVLAVVALTTPPAFAAESDGSPLFALAPLVPAALLSFIASAVIGLFRDLALRARTDDMYDLIEMIGEGGIGQVWRAEHRRLSRTAAIKLIRPEALGNPETAHRVVCRFETEARATAQLRSPHTVEVYDYGTARDGTFYYVMECLDGMDLETLVQNHGPLPPARLVYLLRQACESLAEAHAAGLIHRDIKPANLFVGKLALRHDVVKVLDFGLVTPNNSSLDDEGELTGTPAYLSPEIINRDRGIDTRADIYGLGCVAFFALTGALVFEVEDMLRMAVAHALDEPSAPSARASQVIPAALDAIVLRCLEKHPEDRFATVDELSAALDALALPPWTESHAAAWWAAIESVAAPAPAPKPAPVADYAAGRIEYVVTRQ